MLVYVWTHVNITFEVFCLLSVIVGAVILHFLFASVAGAWGQTKASCLKN